MGSETRNWRERLACWLGKHPTPLAHTVGPFGWPDAYNCTACGRLDHLVDRATGARYADLEQFVEERGGY